MSERPRLGLGGRLIALCTILTVVAVSLSFSVFSLQVRGKTREWMTEAVAREQDRIRKSEARRVTELLRTSHLVTDHPVLRASLEIWRQETLEGTEPHPDLLATLHEATDRVASLADGDLLLLTDDRGRVLVSTGSSADPGHVGIDLSSHSVVRRALGPTTAVGEANLDVVAIDGRSYRVGVVPVVLQGFVIGSLLLGDAIDSALIASWRDLFAGEVLIASGERVIAASSRGLVEGPLSEELLQLTGDSEGSPPVVTLGGQEFVAAAIDLSEGRGRAPARLYLLHSLDGALAASQRSIAATALWIGCFTTLTAALAAWWVSQPVLRPFRAFVEFMNGVAGTGDWSRRFHAPRAGVEVRSLGQACNGLIASLEHHEEAIQNRAREDVERVQRLKESEKLASLGRMLSGAAHEINNPLTGVIGRIEWMLEKAELSPELREKLGSAHQQGRRVSRLVRRLLHVAHRDEGGRDAVEVGGALREAVALRSHDFATAGVKLAVALPDEPLSTWIGEVELQQVLVNIVGNALDALRDREGEPRLHVRLTGREGSVVIEFEDNGPGLRDPEKVFDFFYTTKPVGEGTGLGLGICQSIVISAGGTIEASNLPGGGARFRIELPRLPEGSSSAAGEAEEPHAVSLGVTTLPRDLDGAAILVVDDEPGVLDLQVELLRESGAQVTSAASGSAAIERMQSARFDLVVSDLNMPGSVTGKDLLRFVRETPEPTGPGFLFVTGGTVDEADFLDHCGVPYVLKPFGIKEYTEAVCGALATASEEGR